MKMMIVMIVKMNKKLLKLTKKKIKRMMLVT